MNRAPRLPAAGAVLSDGESFQLACFSNEVGARSTDLEMPFTRSPRRSSVATSQHVVSRTERTTKVGRKAAWFANAPTVAPMEETDA
jgi:hypothetical protein